MADEIEEEIYPVSTTNVIAKQDFYWYDLLTKNGIEVNKLWYSKSFVRSCKGKLKPTIYRRLKKHAHNRRYFLGIEHELYEHRRNRGKGEEGSNSEPYIDDGDSDWEREVAKGR